MSVRVKVQQLRQVIYTDSDSLKEREDEGVAARRRIMNTSRTCGPDGDKVTLSEAGIPVLLLRAEGIHDIHPCRLECRQDTADEAHDEGKEKTGNDDARRHGEAEGHFREGLKIGSIDGDELSE